MSVNQQWEHHRRALVFVAALTWSCGHLPSGSVWSRWSAPGHGQRWQTTTARTAPEQTGRGARSDGNCLMRHGIGAVCSNSFSPLKKRSSFSFMKNRKGHAMEAEVFGKSRPPACPWFSVGCKKKNAPANATHMHDCPTVFVRLRTPVTWRPHGLDPMREVSACGGWYFTRFSDITSRNRSCS